MSQATTRLPLQYTRHYKLHIDEGCHKATINLPFVHKVSFVSNKNNDNICPPLCANLFNPF